MVRIPGFLAASNANNLRFGGLSLKSRPNLPKAFYMGTKHKHQRKLLDLTGMLFGRWTVVRVASMTPKKWLCKCACGIEAEVFQSSLRSGHSKSCGCHSKDTASVGSLLDEIGRVYNGWTVLSFAYSDKYGVARWNCRSRCGDVHVVRGVGLRSGRSTQCRLCAARNKERHLKTGRILPRAS